MAAKRIQISQHPFLLAKAIRIPKLKRRRRVWAYLPKDYFINHHRRYPVIYFNDGQNVFEGWKAAFGKSWDVHLTMENHTLYNNNPHILIGIEHGKKHRKGEYLPFNHNNDYAFEGNVYSDFIANDLKDYVDKNLRTLPDREHTVIVGSSLGGLNALYTGFKHQDVFSKVGVMSPSLWAAPQIFPLIKNIGKHYPSKFYISAGTREGTHTLNHVNNLYHTLLSAGYDPHELKLNFVKNGRHNEALWQNEFANFYKWISFI